jgi:hypothetical protein
MFKKIVLGVFEIEDSRKILEAGKSAGLRYRYYIESSVADPENIFFLSISGTCYILYKC